ncbi:uncharacterized protein DC041_0009660, partial [Schistosoma bovis]
TNELVYKKFDPYHDSGTYVCQSLNNNNKHPLNFIWYHIDYINAYTNTWSRLNLPFIERMNKSVTTYNQLIQLQKYIEEEMNRPEYFHDQTFSLLRITSKSFHNLTHYKYCGNIHVQQNRVCYVQIPRKLPIHIDNSNNNIEEIKLIYFILFNGFYEFGQFYDIPCQTNEIYNTTSNQALTCNSLLTSNVLQYYMEQLLTHYGKDSAYKIGNPIKFGTAEFFDIRISGLSAVQFSEPVDIIDLPSGNIRMIFPLLFDYLVINGKMKMIMFATKPRSVEIKIKSIKIYLDLLLIQPMDNNVLLPIRVNKVTVIHWNNLRFDSKGVFTIFFKMFNQFRLYDGIIKRSIEKEIYQQIERSLNSFFNH